MRVVFDGCCLADAPITGVGRAFLNALRAYAARLHAECVLLLPTGSDDPRLDDVMVVEAPRGALRRQLLLPRLLRRLRADILHSSVAAVPLRAPCATIATVHDLPWLHDEAGERCTAWRRFATRRALRSATAVLAPSRFTLAAAARILGTTRQLHLVPHGTPHLPPDHSTRNGPLLTLGDDRPRKNRECLRKAHQLARTRCPSLPELRFVGPPHAYVSEPHKLHLLRRCCAVVQVSLFEGFGMPVLEAMAAGAPVLCADIPPFHEVAGDTALFVDPRRATAIADGLIQIASDESRHERARRAHERARDFTPDQTAIAWHNLHRELCR